MKMIKRICGILLFLLLFAGTAKVLRYLVNDDTRAYTRIMMHQMHTSKENIDVIFLGASHVYRSLNPEIMDSELGMRTFNCGTSMQHLDGSLALIKEAEASNRLKQVYLDMSSGIANDWAYKERKGLASTYIISDYMRPSLFKLDYLLRSGNSRHYGNSFIVARRDADKLFDIPYVKKLLAKKSQDYYRNYEWNRSEDATSYYFDRGYVVDTEVMLDRNYWKGSIFGRIGMDKVSADWLSSFREICRYCRDHDIRLTLMIVPVPESTLVSAADYQDYEDYVLKLAEEEKLEFFDFNLCRREFFDASDRSLFKDEGHLNVTGAEHFGPLFGSVMRGELKPSEVFYESFSDKLSDGETRVYGLYDLDKDSKDEKRKVGVITNRAGRLEYQVVSGGKVLRDFSSEGEFECTIDELKDMTLRWRSIGENEIFELPIIYNDKKTEV